MSELLFPILSLALLTLGLFCLLSRRRVIKQVIGLSIMLQGALVAVINSGAVIGEPELTQGMAISALLVETIVFAIILALIVNVFRYHPEGLIDDLDQLKG